MIVTCVTVYVKEKHIDDFIQAIIQNHHGSIKESGNVRFDVLQCADDPTRFLIYEVYETQEAVDAHKKTGHYLNWRKKVDDWMEKPREGIRYKIIRPLEKAQWKA